MQTFWKKSGIRRVTYYVASGPVETCDCCSAGIRNVAAVIYADGTTSKFGSTCINKILAQAPSMKTLFNKRMRWLKELQEDLAILNLPVDQMPRGSHYYGSGLYFIGTGKRDIHGNGCSVWHPIIDVEQNQSGEHYVVQDIDARYARDLADIEKTKVWIQAQIEKVERFLAAVLAKAAS